MSVNSNAESCEACQNGDHAQCPIFTCGCLHSDSLKYAAALRSHTDVSRSNACWEWGGHRDKDGYGRISHYRGKPSEAAHRAAYIESIGPIPAGLEIDHLCRTRACVNPSHLEAVTRAENMRRAKAAKTHCSQGHAYDDENAYINPAGARVCRTCKRARQRRAA